MIRPDLASVIDEVADGSLHGHFIARGRIPTSAHAEVSARPAAKGERELMELTVDAVLLCELRVIYDQDGDETDPVVDKAKA